MRWNCVSIHNSSGHQSVRIITACFSLLVLVAVSCLFSEKCKAEIPVSFGSIGTFGPSSFYPVDVVTDNEGNVYATDFFYKSVSKYDRDGALVMKIHDPALKLPRRLNIDNQGRIYVTGLDGVHVYSNSGEVLDMWPIGKTAEGGIEPVSDNRIMLARSQPPADDPGTSRLEVYDSDGNEVDRIGEEILDLAIDVDTLPTGEIYTFDRTRDKIVKFDASGNFVWEVGERGSGPGQFFRVNALALDSNGNIFLTDRGNNRVQKFDADGNFLTLWGSKGRGPGEFHEPCGLSVASDDSIWVAGYHGNSIQHFDNDGNLLERWVGHISGKGEFANITGVAVSNGKLFVVDIWKSSIQVFNALAGNYLYEFGERGEGDATVFNFSRAIAVGPDGDLYISDDQQVRRIKQDGTVIRHYLSLTPGIISGTLGLAVSRENILFQVDKNNNYIIKRDADTGETLLVWGETGSDPGEFQRPTGIAIAEDDTLFVADSENMRVQRFTQNGVFIEQWNTATENPLKLVKPHSVAIDHERNIIYVGGRGRAMAYDLAGNFLDSWLMPGLGEGRTFIATDDKGMVFTTANYGTVYSYRYQSSPVLKGEPSYVKGDDPGVFIWKDSFDGPYHLRVNGGGARASYKIKLVSGEPIGIVEAVTTEGRDTISTLPFGLTLDSYVDMHEDGIDFWLTYGANTLFSIEKDGMVTDPGQLYFGEDRAPLAAAGWLLALSDYPDRPTFNDGEYHGLNIGKGNVGSVLEARWGGGGSSVPVEISVISSHQLEDVFPVNLEDRDEIIQSTPNSVIVNSWLGTFWDGVDIHTTEQGCYTGFTYLEDGLFPQHLVNLREGDLGPPNAYQLPLAVPYGKPSYQPESEAGIFLWKDRNGPWHLKATAGGGSRHYTGRIVSNMPADLILGVGLESSDVLDASDPSQIDFALNVYEKYQDGIDFTFPAEAVVSLEFDEVSSEGADLLQVGEERWPVDNLPLSLSKW